MQRKNRQVGKKEGRKERRKERKKGRRKEGRTQEWKGLAILSTNMAEQVD